MGTEDATLVLRVPCRIAYTTGTFDFDEEFPHDSGDGLAVALGITEMGVHLAPNNRYDYITAHEYGGETTEIVEGGSSYVAGINLKQYDDDVIGQLFPLSPTGGWQHPPTVTREGVLLSTRGVKLVCSPNASGSVAVYFPLAVPILDASARLRFGVWRKELIFPTMWHALRPSSGSAVYVNTLANLP